MITIPSTTLVLIFDGLVMSKSYIILPADRFAVLAAVIVIAKTPFAAFRTETEKLVAVDEENDLRI
jgi:hypothetical protein